MDKAIETLARITRTEFDGPSLMGGDPRPKLYSNEQADWPKTPAKQDEEAWAGLLADLAKIHADYLGILESMNPERMDEEVTAWNRAVRQALECMAVHDLYHVSQIRNMGLKGMPMKKAKEEELSRGLAFP
jgi:hypothetical protein